MYDHVAEKYGRKLVLVAALVVVLCLISCVVAMLIPDQIDHIITIVGDGNTVTTGSGTDDDGGGGTYGVPVIRIPLTPLNTILLTIVGIFIVLGVWVAFPYLLNMIAGEYL